KIKSIEQYSFASGFPTITEPPRVNALLPDPDALGSEKWARIAARGVGPDYFETVGIRVLSGEPYHVEEREEGVSLAVINSALAARYWPDQNAIGKRIKFYEADAPFEITAVVENAVSMTPGDEQEPMLYPLIWHWTSPSTMVVKTNHAYSEVATEIRKAFASVNPDATVGEIVPGNAGLRAATKTRGVTATLFWAFGLLALGLSASLTLRSVSTAANRCVRAISLRRSVRDLKDVGLRPLFAAVVVGLVAGGVLSAPFSDLMAREFSLDGQAGVLRVALPALLLITMHAVVAYVPIRQFARVAKTRRLH
ncbi:MAG TPA: ABC transporter permease, partial [Rhodothermia bacterium]